MSRLTNILTNIFLVLLFIQVAPSMVDAIKTNYTNLLEPKTKIGLLSMKDTITDAAVYSRELKKFFEKEDIKGIVIKMDCPGGCAGASQAVFNDLKELKKQHLKPVVVWVQNICASGGYYIACAADRIIATPSAFIGSIGAYIAQPELKKFIEQWHIKYQAIAAGSYKTAGNPLLEMTEAQQALLQGIVDDTYDQFIQAVSEQRPQLTLATATTWADGKIFTGKQALALGLIDELGSAINAEQYIKQKLAIEGEIEWVRPSCASGFMKLFKGDCDADTQEEKSLLTATVEAVGSYVTKETHQTVLPHY